MKLDKNIVRFLARQGIVIVSSYDRSGSIHCAVKGIVGIEEDGAVFVIDLYKAHTYKNLMSDPRVSITAVDEEKFTGWTLQGKAKIVQRQDIAAHIQAKWEEKIVNRISSRLLKSLKKDRGAKHHFEAALPTIPQYLIEIDIDNVIDLQPACVRKT